jgi:excisionase family DNA binding protein
MKQPDEQLFTLAEVALELKISEQSLRKWIKAGRIAAVKLPNGRWRLNRKQIEEALRYRIISNLKLT